MLDSLFALPWGPFVIFGLRIVDVSLDTVRVVSRDGGAEIADALRQRGYGVTEFGGQGRDGRVEILNSVVQRQDLEEVIRIVDRWDPGAFVTVEEPKLLRGGSVARRGALGVPWRRGGERGSK